MTKRSMLLSTLALGFLAAPAAAERLLVAGPDGLVMQADTDQGTFAYFACQCAGSIRAMAADQEWLYVADDFGQILVFDVQSGAMRNLFSPPLGQINALAAAGGSVFVGTEAGQVVRIDPRFGDMLDIRTAPAAVRALLAHGGNLFVGAADSAVYRAPIEGGDFDYFSCFCFFDIQGMVLVGGEIAIADASGITAIVDDQTGAILTAFFAGPTNSLAELDGHLLFYYQGGGGAITRFDPVTGTPVDKAFVSPVGVEEMLVLPDVPKVRRRR